MDISEDRAAAAREKTYTRRAKTAKVRELKDKGMSNVQIANEVGYSESTVRALVDD